MERCSTSLVIWEMEIKTTVRYYTGHNGENKKQGTNVGENVETKKAWCTIVGMQTGAATVETVWKFLK